ncbi:Uncharacterised protein [Nocardia otitidiscaviarum]|uniref:DUF4913 domain-containing protein n=2 Tax=Nocardia otitidiscaviarum TaxID=1823 RepID=A0A379JJ60_9NOCA|nr:Uncharacterised protein [Nocardia otitidiscaviarum]
MDGMSDWSSPYVYPSVIEFVENYLSVVYRRDVVNDPNQAWCVEWWKHAEAVARLDVLWRAWEHYRLDSRTGLSVWFLDHADPQMARLLAANGPFRFCSVTNGHQSMLGPLPLVSPRKGLFTDPTA